MLKVGELKVPSVVGANPDDPHLIVHSEFVKEQPHLLCEPLVVDLQATDIFEVFEMVVLN